ncbi:MAG: hypothetical protein F6K63_13170 [Moorea sp. SIO1G6]|nr:hypothetical protein [Moorena sp. SIO1G6]
MGTIAVLNWVRYLALGVLGSRESGAVRPVANLIRLRKAHRGSRESG